ncbi:hypothetical protein Clopa_4230 [Clostridium pasteurianum BC1]|uniref:Uncharacterized protein n=1 Tax=Clostridium pasteurianum BC1 TaxID=86416 RepID=R4KBA0_CLOPA|nr:hypothetical protein Clopa_4230 [Clostridium pasteurianum BC1]
MIPIKTTSRNPTDTKGYAAIQYSWTGNIQGIQGNANE